MKPSQKHALYINLIITFQYFITDISHINIRLREELWDSDLQGAAPDAFIKCVISFWSSPQVLYLLEGVVLHRGDEELCKRIYA